VRRLLRWLCILLILLVIILASGYFLLRGSLPQLNGQANLEKLSQPVSLLRDANGVLTVEAGDELDMARALGFAHAQERFFEMDLMRRRAAGELAELFGEAALPADRQMRLHRLRARSRANLEAALGDKRNLLEAYRDGVNAGLSALTARPWPYLLLRQLPRQWELEDSVLVVLAMYDALQDTDNARELALIELQKTLPPALYQLLTHNGSQWDAPLFGLGFGNAKLPTAEQLDLRTLPGSTPIQADKEPYSGIGSNNFAVGRGLTADGRAILAGDMHLALRAPNIWYRARLRYAEANAAGGQVDVSGFSLPGVPGIIAGSNGHVAWTFTNSYIDTADFARIAKSEAGKLQSHFETIAVAGKPAQRLQVRESDWGPIVRENADGSLLALRWAAHLPGAVTMGLLDMAKAANLDDAQKVADNSGLPVQNLLLVDENGAIAWRLIGARPERGNNCQSAAINENCVPWAVRLDQSPTRVSPLDERLWTANTRVLEGAALAKVGDGGYDLGARAFQIRDGLLAKKRFNEGDLLAIALDDRALLMEFWWQQLQQTLSASSHPALKALQARSGEWDGSASANSMSYRLAREFRDQVQGTLKAALLAPAQLDKDFAPPRLAQFEGVAVPLLEQRPAHLLPPPFTRWDELLEQSALQVAQQAQASNAPYRWGQRNRAAICHPLARALPEAAKPWLCMPPDALPGDHNMPRVQTPTHGASQRMVVSPGHEDEGIIHMPGGQSGHLLSPFWGKGHADWVEGRATPFLPGQTQYRLKLNPEQ